MNDGDQAICRDIAREIVKEVLVTYNETHIATCPHGRSLLKLAFISIGIAIGSGLASGGIIITALKLFGA